jgi:PIN domain nuclease of toxin-antitoxin system
MISTVLCPMTFSLNSRAVDARLARHAHLLLVYDTPKLSPSATAAIREADEVSVSSASIWEIAIKLRLGKLRADPNRLLELMNANDFQELPVSNRHAARVATLPLHHTDPFDRLLIAQAMSEPLHLFTVDSQLKPYSELVICV